MLIKEAKTYVNTRVNLSWVDRNGAENAGVVDVYEVNFVPFYGPCMITSMGEIRLDRIQSCELEVRRIAM